MMHANAHGRTPGGKAPDPAPPSILLLGPRGCGKTTIGARLAEALQRRFVDLDAMTLDEFEHVTVQDVWSRHGQGGWRRAEVRVLDAVLGEGGLIVALGGGTPMIDAARQMIAHDQRRGRAVVVYLQCAAAELARRLAAAPGDRPSLTGRPIDVEIADVLADREPTYLHLADVVCAADDATVDEVVARLVRELAEQRPDGRPLRKLG
jgi:shikimate kinase